MAEDSIIRQYWLKLQKALVLLFVINIDFYISTKNKIGLNPALNSTLFSLK